MMSKLGQVVVFIALVALLFLFSLQSKSSEAVLKESSKLVELNTQRNLTTSDLVVLRKLVQHNAEALAELQEVKFFVSRNESVHVDHTLPQVYFAFAGEVVPCPLDDLSHVSVYLRYGENDLAGKSLVEAREGWVAWLEKAEKTKAKNPSTYPMLEAAKQKALVVFNAVDLSEATEELSYIERNGFC